MAASVVEVAFDLAVAVAVVVAGPGYRLAFEPAFVVVAGLFGY